jgi:hypothetical protein
MIMPRANVTLCCAGTHRANCHQKNAQKMRIGAFCLGTVHADRAIDRISKAESKANGSRSGF